MEESKQTEERLLKALLREAQRKNGLAIGRFQKLSTVTMVSGWLFLDVYGECGVDAVSET